MGTHGKAPPHVSRGGVELGWTTLGTGVHPGSEDGRELQTDLGFLCPPPSIIVLFFPSFHLGGIARLHPLLSGISIAPVGSPTMCPGVTHQQQTVKRKKIGWKYQCTLVTINPAFNLC